MLGVKRHRSDGETLKSIVQLYLQGKTTPYQEEYIKKIFYGGLCKDVSASVLEQVIYGVKRKRPLHQALLGQMYCFGWGVSQNIQKGKQLLCLSHKHGCIRCTSLYIEFLLGKFGVEESNAEAVFLLEKAYATENGRKNASILFMLGQQYYDTDDKKMLEKAFSLYREAALMSHPFAMFETGLCYYNALGVEFNLLEAVRWIRRGSALGHERGPEAIPYLRKTYAGSEDLNPYGDWEPTKEIHSWCSDSMDKEMIIALLVCKRINIPQNVAVAHLLPFICSLPH